MIETNDKNIEAGLRFTLSKLIDNIYKTETLMHCAENIIICAAEDSVTLSEELKGLSIHLNKSYFEALKARVGISDRVSAIIEKIKEHNDDT